MRRIILGTVALVLLSCAAFASGQATRKDVEKNVVLKAMLEELDRSSKSLQLQGFEKPYFIEYRLDDVDDLRLVANYGAPVVRNRNHQRLLSVTVRVGSYKLDSSSPQGQAAQQIAAEDDDIPALRTVLWNATDLAYKSALGDYARKQAALKQVETLPQADDFSREKPLIHLETPQKLVIDEKAWMEQMAEVSMLYRKGPHAAELASNLTYSSAAFHARVTNEYLVNSEGSIVCKTSSGYQEGLGLGTQAPDGQRIDRSYASVDTSLERLDNRQSFREHGEKLLAALVELRNSPVVEEEYHGPVLFSNDASTDIVNELLAPAVVAMRPQLGTQARTVGPFASSYHARVLPDFLSLVDDPRIKTLQGVGLVGSYDVDEQAVAAQAVELVSTGHLQNYLIGRAPVRDIPQSNGHGRAPIAGPAHPFIGVLQLKSEKGQSMEELKKQLISILKDRGLNHGYLVQTFGPGLTPRLLYKIGLDGKQELVRGAVLDDLDQRALRSGILAAGNEPFISNYFNEVPTTTIAPALLLEDVTVKRANEKLDKLPYYPPPAE